MKLIKVIVCVLILSIAIPIVLGLIANHRNAILEERMNDVKILGEIYNKSSNSVENISILQKAIAEKGIKLYNPIPKNMALPCYEIVNGITNAHGIVQIQETTNVADSRYVVRLYQDGVVIAEPK
jgi:hypothetical protein